MIQPSYAQIKHNTHFNLKPAFTNKKEKYSFVAAIFRIEFLATTEQLWAFVHPS